MTNYDALGLDVGTSRLVLAQKEGERFRFASQLNAFVSIPYSRMTENALRNERVPYSIENGQLIVHGNESARFADLLQRETRRPMFKGVLNPAEPESAPRLKELLRTLLANHTPGKRVYFTVPAAPLGSEEGVTYHEATIKQLLAELGFEGTAVNEGLAVIYGELEKSNYSGIGVSLGGGLANVCLAYLSVPVLSFSTAKAGDFVDSSAAAVTGELATRVRLAKEESFTFQATYSDKLHQVLAVYYDDLIKTLAGSLREAFSNARNLPRLARPIPLVLSGGTASPRGFRDRFEKILNEQPLPIGLSEIRLAAHPLESTAKGALIAALADSVEPVSASAAA